MRRAARQGLRDLHALAVERLAVVPERVDDPGREVNIGLIQRTIHATSRRMQDEVNMCFLLMIEFLLTSMFFGFVQIFVE